MKGESQALHNMFGLLYLVCVFSEFVKTQNKKPTTTTIP